MCWGTPSRPVDDHSKIESLAVERKITSRYGVDSRPLSEWPRDAWRALQRISIRSKTGLPTLVDSSAPCPSDPAPLPVGPEEGRPVLGREGPAAGEPRRRGDRRAPSTWEAVRLSEANWYPTRNVGASEAIQISANLAECVRHRIDHILDEKLPANSRREREVAH